MASESNKTGTVKVRLVRGLRGSQGIHRLSVKANCLPPLTVLETRLTATSFSLKSPPDCESSYCCA